MTDFENVTLRTTKDVVTKATSSSVTSAEYDRRSAWEFLSPTHALADGAWAGRLANEPSIHAPTSPLSEVAARYDEIVRSVEFDSDQLVTETDVLASLLAIREIRSKLQTDEVRLIAAARRKKVTWQRLAGALELKSRSAAERRYLQLRADLDHASGKQLTQTERVEYARAQRDRKAERTWAVSQATRIILLARQLAAVPDLQGRADRSPENAQAHGRATRAAIRAGTPVPAPVSAPWPHQLVETLEAEEQLRAESKGILPLHSTAQRTGGVRHTDLIHSLFGLIGYAVDPSQIALADHTELVADIRMLYNEAGPAAPRSLSDIAPSEISRSRRRVVLE
ncbi:hypothetical protein ABTX85_30935 [Streptomyces sp. NPDC096097]|uniref:hypothetical protein n=1 Tax=Streptomyces sp. NPDC096097 TaxID=3155546 RepID=UPI00332541AA